MDKIEFSNQELLFGYKEIVLFYERGMQHGIRGFNKNRLNRYLKKKKIDLYSKGVIGNNDFRNNKVSFFQYKKHQNLSELVSLFRHMRNCFAHGSVEKIKIGGRTYFCFEDIHTSGVYKGQQSMIGQIPKSDFKVFVQKLKENQKVRTIQNQ